jgi:hypothetical protein
LLVFFHRLLISVGGVEVLRFSTQEPTLSRAIHYSTGRLLTPYISYLKAPETKKKLVVTLDNLINDQYTGVFEVDISFKIYNGESKEVADEIYPISQSNDSYPFFRIGDNNVDATVTLPILSRLVILSSNST